MMGMMMRMMEAHLNPRYLLLLWLCSVREAQTKAIPDPAAIEVQIKVQVFDSTDLSSLANAEVEVHSNQSVLASSRAEGDGVVRVSFLYRVGSWVIISASKKDYITNSLPWTSSRIPLYASVSLYLLAQRPGTLILYDDVLQVLSGSPGARNQPLVQLQRKSIQLPVSSNYTSLWATLTTARSQYEIGGFPFLLGQETNSSGAETWTDLTALAVFSVQLFDKDGSNVQVSEPSHVSVPLPPDTRIRTATSVPSWFYQPKTGLWVRNGTGYIHKEGAQFVWSVVIPQTGYWLAAFPSSSGFGLSHPGLRDITTYHTLFLLSILGSLALLVLILLCVLLYYCRRKCLKPRRQQGKPHISSLGGAKRDQGTSTSRLNLICGGHVETGASTDKSDLTPTLEYQSSREDLTKHVPAHKLRNSKGKNPSGPQRGESFPMKVTQSTETNNLDNPLLHEDYKRSYSPKEGKESDYHRHHNANDNRGYASDPPSPPCFQGYVPSQSDKPPEYSAAAVDSLTRPTSLNTQPGQIIFCSSIDQMKENMYRSMVPTLVIPAHYMRLPSEFSGKEGKDTKDQDKDATQMGGGSQHHHHHSQNQQQQQGGSQGDDSEGPSWASDSSGRPVTIPVLFNDSTMAQMNGELQALTEKKLLELGVKQHPRAWFISLDGRDNAHVRHSYIDAGNDLSGGGGFGIVSSSVPRDVNLEPPLEIQERKSSAIRRGKEERWGTGGRKSHGVGSSGGKIYSKLAYPDHTEPSISEGRPVSPEENSLTPLLDEGSSTQRSTIPRQGRSRGNSNRSSNSENRRDSMTSPDDDPDDKDENKKSPWQKIEDRPLMVFHPRK
ncbi:protein FAM171A2 [Gouania willdenowi]|uniref:Protein FAM171A2 n=1 Tax=Gouania willdenowi TaxID=441366 RepID=A0A8C5HTR5_GOUWI|nr:protein FAM171A2 [Gouania willdenowi]